MIVRDNEPEIVQNVLILKWGSEPYRDDQRLKHEKEETDMPYGEIYLTRSFQSLEVAGKAKNFEKTEEGIVCDLVIEDGYFKTALNEEKEVTAAPKIEGEPSDDGEELKEAQLESVSLIVNHAQPSLNGNVTKAYSGGD